MPEPLTMPARAPATPAASVGVTAGSGAPNGDAGAFENILQAGLAGRAGAATGTAVPAGPAVLRPAATPKSQTSAAASDDCGNAQNASGDDGALNSLAALFAHGSSAVATPSPAAGGSERDASPPAAAPTLTDQRPQAATAALAAALVLPTLVQPTSVQPTLVQPTLVQPTLVQPALVQPALVQPTLGQPTPEQPTPGQPAVTPKAIEMVSNPDRQVDLSANAATPARHGRTVGGDALQKDPAAPVAYDAGTPCAGIPGSAAVPRDLPGIPGNEAADATRLLLKSAEAGTRTVRCTVDTTEKVPSVQQQQLTGRDELRNVAESPDAARHGDGLQDPIQPFERPTDRLTDRVDERFDERAADRPADPAARIDTILRKDAAPRLDTSHPAPERAGPVPVLNVDHSLGSPEWQREFGSQVSVLVSRREPQAEIRLNPPQLGPVEVRIGVQGDQVSLAFTVPQPDTRAAIENALPQLREMFAASGLALGDASVSAESSRQQSPRDNYPQPAPFLREVPIAVDAVPGLRHVVVRLVDTFA